MYCEQLDSMCSSNTDDVIEHIASYKMHIDAGQFKNVLDGVESHIDIQLNFAITALEHRMTSYAAQSRFIECFHEFTEGIGYTSDDPSECKTLYSDAYQRYYRPFFDKNPHILENYLINSMRTTLFPLGPQKAVYLEGLGIFEQYISVIINYTLLRSMMIGTAAYYREAFDSSHVVRCVQTFVKAVEHNPPYKNQILKSFRENGMDKMGIIAVLLKN
jgi:lysine-N-methylase